MTFMILNRGFKLTSPFLRNHFLTARSRRGKSEIVGNPINAMFFKESFEFALKERSHQLTVTLLYTIFVILCTQTAEANAFRVTASTAGPSLFHLHKRILSFALF